MKCLVVVAHPDDEIIWMGGLILRHPEWDWRIVSLCRANDVDRAPRFYRAAAELGARASISNLDDSPALAPLSSNLQEIKQRISALASDTPDLIFTHGANGEYTRHERHEQTHKAVRDMIDAKDITGELLYFAYDDCSGECRPKPADDADIVVNLLDEEYDKKRKIVRDIYGFSPDSFELNACGPVEAFRVHGKMLDIGRLQTLIQNSD